MSFFFNKKPTGPLAKYQSVSTVAGAISPKWQFTEEELKKSPSILAGISYSEEQRSILQGCTCIRMISGRINDMNKDSKISQLCVCVSMIHLRRFFTVHPLKHFDAMDVGAAILFLCTKSEDCPRRLEYIVRTWYRIRYELETVNPDNEIIIDEKTYHTFCEYITWLESIVLQTIGFNFGVEVPHPFVLKLAQQYRANDNKFMEAAFWLTTDALHLTNWTVRYKPSTIGCICYYMTSIWKDETPVFPPNSSDGKPWFYKIDKTVTLDLLKSMTQEFLLIWKNVESKNVHLSMSRFDHSTPPVSTDYSKSPHAWYK